MKKLILAGFVAALFGSPVLAQSYNPGYGSGNIAPNVTAANPDGTFRYTPNNGSSGAAAYAQAPNAAHTRHVRRVHPNN